MVSEKVIVVLLVLSILLSIGSIAVTTSLNLDSIRLALSHTGYASSDSGSGKVQLFVESPTGGK